MENQKSHKADRAVNLALLTTHLKAWLSDPEGFTVTDLDLSRMLLKRLKHIRRDLKNIRVTAGQPEGDLSILKGLEFPRLLAHYRSPISLPVITTLASLINNQ